MGLEGGGVAGPYWEHWELYWEPYWVSPGRTGSTGSVLEGDDWLGGVVFREAFLRLAGWRVVLQFLVVIGCGAWLLRGSLSAIGRGAGSALLIHAIGCGAFPPLVGGGAYCKFTRLAGGAWLSKKPFCYWLRGRDYSDLFTRLAAGATTPQSFPSLIIDLIISCL